MTHALARRDFLTMAGVAAVSGLLPACGTGGRRPLVVDPRRRFVRVKVSPDRVIRTVVGLRPFRPSGFVVRAQKLGEKTVIHNYGHGGGGMTMSWGTAHLAVEQALETGQRDYAVLGCGGVGLATARLLQRHGFAVTIYAKDLPPNTTSNIAGAQWSPAESYDHEHRTPAFAEQFTRAARLSHREFQNMVGDYYGVRWIENYFVSDTAPATRNPQGASQGIPDLYPDGHHLSRREHPFPGAYVRRFTTLLIEPPVYLNAMLRDFFLAGGKLVVRELADLKGVAALSEPIVMNCTGLGAKALFGDDELMPIKGQLTILLPQSDVDYITLTDELYMFPRRDGILLGGTHERGVWTMEPNAEAAAHILDGHARFFAQMR
jgi:D-amino-acid oxidase